MERPSRTDAMEAGAELSLRMHMDVHLETSPEGTVGPKRADFTATDPFL